jgi:RNA polymerase sigma-70 factor (ECF subfamily)
MTEPSAGEVTQLLLAWRNGDQEAVDKLLPLVYEELHRLAARYMGRERTDHTLQTTALVNEAYVRLTDGGLVHWQDRSHFFAVSAQIMRRILVDAARAHRSDKRGGEHPHVSFDEALTVSPEPRPDLLALDEALNALAAIDPRKSKVVELRFFGGLSVQETAQALNVSPDTVMRDWRLAKAWLLRELSSG